MFISNGKYLVQCINVFIFFLFFLLLLNEMIYFYVFPSFKSNVTQCYFFLIHTIDNNVKIYCSLRPYIPVYVENAKKYSIFELSCFKTIKIKPIVWIIVHNLQMCQRKRFFSERTNHELFNTLIFTFACNSRSFI